MQNTDDSAWDSEVDSAHSVTSTPDFKRGKHETTSSTSISSIIRKVSMTGNSNGRGKKRKASEIMEQKLLDEQAREHIRWEAEEFIQHQGRKKKRSPSVHILADSRIQAWLVTDGVCTVDYHPGWSFKRWLEALRVESIRICCNIVIVYFEAVKDYQDVPPVKNALQAICKVIRQHRKEARIYVGNLLPKPSPSPMDKPDVNFVLLQAVRSVNRILRKVHYLSIREHFISKKGKVLCPVHKYFQEDNMQLTTLGCLVLRECLLREAGLKRYWFD